MESENRFEKQIFSVTTLIESSFSANGKRYHSQGTGFYYTEQTPTDPEKKGPQWYSLDKYWLITNRHVVLPHPAGDDNEYVPDEFTFCLREIIGSTISWKPITLSGKELLSVLKLHSSPVVDVACIDVTAYIKGFIEEMSKTKQNNIMIPATLSNLNLPQNQPLEIDVTSDVVVASYPKGFYDDQNKFPIIKSGIVASAWNFNFKGLPIFQIDAQLFPGSSGGLVISKPTNIATFNGKPQFSERKEFVLLGVYSGEFKWYESLKIGDQDIKVSNSYGLGNVWYSYLIPQIIENGIEYQ